MYALGECPSSRGHIAGRLLLNFVGFFFWRKKNRGRSHASSRVSSDLSSVQAPTFNTLHQKSGLVRLNRFQGQDVLVLAAR